MDVICGTNAAFIKLQKSKIIWIPAMLGNIANCLGRTQVPFYLYSAI